MKEIAKEEEEEKVVDSIVDKVVVGDREKCEEAVVEKIEDSQSEDGEPKYENVGRHFKYEPLIAKETPEVGINRAQVEVPESIDRLGESVYKLNKYLNLKKDIKALQKENCVRDDIKKKLDLKERWLSTPSPVDSISNKFTFNSRTLSRDSIASGFSNRSAESTLPLFENAMDALNRDEERKAMEENFDKIAIAEKKPLLSRSDSLENLLREKELKQQKLMQPLKNLESISFANTMDFMKSKIAAPKVKAQDSCDLSKYFPDKKVDKKAAGDVNKTQKTLKDVDLAQYFNANLPKESVAENKPPQRPPRSSPVPKVKVEETLNESDFNMFDQLMDGAIDLKLFMKHIQGDHTDWSNANGTSGGQLEVNYEVAKSPSQEYKQFFGNMEEDGDDVSISLDDLIDEHAVSDFESIVSNSIASPVAAAPKVEPPEKPLRLSLQKKKPEEMPKKKGKSVAPIVAAAQKPKRVKSFSKPADPHRGIESTLVPPKPRTIRSIPGMILNSVKGKKGQEKKKAEVQNEKAIKTGAKAKVVNSPISKPVVKPVEGKAKKEVPVKIPVAVVEKPKVDYVPDPKVAKYFFDDVSILGDLDDGKEDAGSEIFEDALETSSTKRLSEIDRIFERINSVEEVEQVKEKTMKPSGNIEATPLSPPDEDVQMVDNAIYVPATPEKQRSLDDETEELDKSQTKNSSKDVSPKVEKVTVNGHSSEDSSHSTSSRREALLKMHTQSVVANGNEKDPSLPPTPTPRRRSKSKSTEPTSPIPPRRLRKYSKSGSAESGKTGDLVPEKEKCESPVVPRRDVEPSRKISEPEKSYAGKYESTGSSYPKRRSADYSDYSSSQYDNYSYRDPLPTTTTNYLLNKSKNLHDRKREFMNERVSSNNPYMRRMLSREEREDKINAVRSALDDSRTMYNPTTRSAYSSRMNPLDSSSYYSPSSRYNTTSSAYSPSSSHSFMDYFRRAPQSPPRRDPRGDARDGCAIS